jgi:acid phosphatase type 7
MSIINGFQSGKLAAFSALVTIAVIPAVYAEDVVVMAAGDIAKCGSSGHGKTAKLISPTTGPVLALGDLAYNDGSLKNYKECYEPTWGKFKDRTYPVPGNHEYYTPNAADYFTYWGKRAGPAGRGYYSFDLGQWHIVALDSNLKDTRMARQNSWLQDDLAKNKRRCVLAYWHHPLFSSSEHGNDPRMRGIADTLYAHKTSVILAGHDHVYERFFPQTPGGKRDLKQGITMFNVGTGGAPLYEFETIHPNSRARYNNRRGVLKLTLKPAGYSWSFINSKKRVKDKGKADCI